MTKKKDLVGRRVVLRDGRGGEVLSIKEHWTAYGPEIYLQIKVINLATGRPERAFGQEVILEVSRADVRRIEK